MLITSLNRPEPAPRNKPAPTATIALAPQGPLGVRAQFAANSRVVVHRRLPRPALRPFVRLLWASDGQETPSAALRERVLPTGTMHVVVRLDQPLRLFEDSADAKGRVIAHALVGGARSTFYIRDVQTPSRSVGAQFQPGAAPLLLGLSASELADAHTPLAEAWGSAAATLHEQLLSIDNVNQRLDVFEAALAARLPRVRGVHPAVAHALARFSADVEIGQIVKESGYSHRHFIALFRDLIGLPPKVYCRVLRLQNIIDRMAEQPLGPHSDLALTAGYSDQSHFSREFRAFAGISPGEYGKLAPVFAHHVPILPAP